MMFGFNGSITMSPTAREAWWSVRGVQVGVAERAFVDFQTPPCAPPVKTMLGLVGWTAMAETRPLTGVAGPTDVSVWPLGMVEGPIEDQAACAGGPPGGVGS